MSLFLPLGVRRPFAAAVAGLCFVAAGAAAIALFAADDVGRGIVEDAIRRDRLAEFAQVLVMATGLLAVLVSYRERDKEDRAGEYYALLLTATSGMAFFVAANNLMTLFLGLEWFSICLYILTAIAVERLSGLEASLKYLIVGSFGSAILLFGSAFVFGATGALDFAGIAAGHGRRRAAVRRRRPGDDHRRPGVQGLRGAVPHVDARRLRGRADAGDRLHGRRDEGGGASSSPCACSSPPSRARRSSGRSRSR